MMGSTGWDGQNTLIHEIFLKFEKYQLLPKKLRNEPLSKQTLPQRVGLHISPVWSQVAFLGRSNLMQICGHLDCFVLKKIDFLIFG